jgi:hypothetical protein
MLLDFPHRAGTGKGGPDGPPQAVEKVAQPQNYCVILLSALAAPANFGHIQEVCSLICRFAALTCTIFDGLHVFRQARAGRTARPSFAAIVILRL